MPGTDPMEAAALIAGELPDLPHLVELPARGAGADMIGRATAVCLDMPAEVMPSGWRLARRPGRDSRRAADLLAWDLDAAERHFAGAPWVKVQVAGPWTLAANIETPNGNRAVADPGATRDLASSLAEGVRAFLAAIGRRLPGTGLVLQIDEPSLPDVLAGTLPTASGLGAVPAVETVRAADVLRDLAGGTGADATMVHCCHRDAPLEFLDGCGFDAISVELTRVADSSATLDALGVILERGTVVCAGLVPAVPPAGSGMTGEPGSAPRAGAARADGVAAADVRADGGGGFTYRDAAAPMLTAWHRLGMPEGRREQIVVTPTCGLAGASQAWSRRALAIARDTARLLADGAGG